MATRYTTGAAVKATATITVVNYLLCSQSQIIINDEPNLNENSDWTAATSNEVTAQSIADAVNFSSSSTTASVLGAVVTLTAKVAGAAGNAYNLVIIQTLVGLVISGDTFSGGADGSAIGSIISLNPIKIKSIEVKSNGTALDANILNGTTSGGTEYDTVTGTSTKTVSRSYVHGLCLPGGGYIVGGADVTQIVIDFEQIG